MALGLTQPLTEMSTRNLLGGKGRLECKADNLAAICEPIVSQVWRQILTALFSPTLLVVTFNRTLLRLTVEHQL
jgi:hypothetical protein